MSPSPDPVPIPIGTTSIRTQEWRILNFGKVRQLYAHDVPFRRKIFWLSPPSTEDNGDDPPAKSTSWFITLYPSGKALTYDYIAVSFGAEATAAEKERLNWRRVPVDYAIEAYYILSPSGSGESPLAAMAPRPVFMSRTTGMGRSFTSTKPEYTDVRFLSCTKTPKWDAKHNMNHYDLLLRLHFVCSETRSKQALGPPIRPKPAVDPLIAFVRYLDTDLYTDVIFTFPNDPKAINPSTLRSHRFLLAVRSSYFGATFGPVWNSSPAPFSPTGAITIPVPDATHNHFAILLYHLYSGSLPSARLPARTLRGVYRAAHMYYFAELMDVVEKVLWRRLEVEAEEGVTSSDWQDYLAFAIENGLEKMRKGVICWMADRWDIVKGSGGMEEFGRKWRARGKEDEDDSEDEIEVKKASPIQKETIATKAPLGGRTPRDERPIPNPRHSELSSSSASPAALPAARVGDALSVLSQDLGWLSEVFLRLGSRVTSKGWTCSCCERVVGQA